MTYRVKILEDRNGDWPDLANTYFQMYDPEVVTPKGVGRLHVCPDRRQATRFPDQLGWARLIDQYPALRSLTVLIEPEEAEAGGDQAVAAVWELLQRAGVGGPGRQS